MIEVKVPSPGESITEVQLASWLVENNTYVNKDDEIAEIDSDKATLSITAPESGLLIHKKEEGTSLEVDEILCHIDTSAAPPDEVEAISPPEEAGPDSKIEKMQPASPGQKEISKSKENEANIVQGKASTNDSLQKTETKGKQEKHLRVSPLAKKQMQEQGISKEQILEKYGSFRIGRDEISAISKDSPEVMQQKKEISRDTEHKKMSPLRIKLAERLVAVKNQTAMLTTFNEVNMSPVMEIRKEYKEEFKEKHNISLGLMSFFTKAVAVSLELFPQINARLEDEHIVYHKYLDIGIAVSAPKGLMVPVIRNAGALSMADIEHEIRNLALKARDNKLSLEEMSGGTFTITNGGVFGSMLSTPIINPPQSAILGMHNIVDRPVAVNGKVEIHPVMYVALSYDHRIIDGKESVGFLRSIKELLENPLSLLLEGRDPYRQLLDL